MEPRRAANDRSVPAPTDAKPSRRGVGARFTVVATSFVLALAIAEVFVRVTGETDADGSFTWRGIATWPVPLPIAEHDRLIAPLREGRTPRLVEHAQLGWIPNPVPEAFHGLYLNNDDGVRCGSDRKRYSESPAPGVMRIVLLGDSFTYGDELPFEQTWGARLEAVLNAAGEAAEVINLGVSGYGIDQAILRFRELGMKWNPTHVILGLRLENAARNLSIVRLFYKRTSGVPFTKPRFVLGDSGVLSLVNHPALDYESLNRMLHDGSIRDWEPLTHDRFAAPYLATSQPWHHSRVLSLLEYRLRSETLPNPDRITADPSSEAFRLALALLRELDSDARSSGAELIALHLSTKSDKQKPDPLLAAVEGEMRFIDTAAVLRKKLKERGATLIRREGAHYTKEACEIIADIVAE